MPKIQIDYSNTIFYKIYCRDSSINELYIGHTTNFVQRKYAHKQGVINVKSANYNCKLYNVIRNNEGWDNWKMEIIAFHECNGLMSAKKYEQQYFEDYKATLNSIEPLPKPKPIVSKVVVEQKKQEPLYSDKCNIYISPLNNQEIHNNHVKHLSYNHQMPTDAVISFQNSKKFYCEVCSLSCSKKSDLIRHYSTTKHVNATKMLPITTQVAIHGNKSSSGAFLANKSALPNFICNCGKQYIHRSSFYRHKKGCYKDVTDDNENNENNENNVIIESSSENTAELKKMILILLKENKEIQNNFMELVVPHMKGTSINSNNTITNNTTNNNQFNVNMFLNEHCKNAMNLTDFIHSLPITSETYDNTIENGLTKTITNMVVTGLNQLDILERPIHCTDAARKTIYVKEEDKWEKDTEMVKLLLGIKSLARKQRTMINKWKDNNKGWDKDEVVQMKLTNLICNSMTDIEHDKKETGKIIRAISKNVYLDNESKQQYL